MKLKNIVGTIVLLGLLSCQEQKSNAPLGTNTVDSLAQKNGGQLPQNVAASYEEDTSFVNNGIKFTILRDINAENAYIVEKNQNGQKEKVLEFDANDIFGYSIRDKNEDNYADIIIRNDPMKRFYFYIYDPKSNKFVDNGYWFGAWSKVAEGVFCDFPIDLKDSNFSSTLFTIENGKINSLGIIEVELGEGSNEKFKTFLIKYKNGNDSEEDWREAIKQELVDKYLGSDGDDFATFFKEVWQDSYKRFL